MVKKLHHNYLKPQNYYNRLFTFFILISLSLTILLINLKNDSIEIFLFKFILICFLLMCIAILVEYFYRGEYMSPLEIYDIELFSKDFISNLNNSNCNNKYFNKYDSKSKKNYKKISSKKDNYFLSSIRKKKDIYEITLINERKMLEYYILKFLIKGAMHKIYLKKKDENIKIVKFE